MIAFPFYNSLFLIEPWYPLKIFKHIQSIDCSKDSLGEGNGNPLQYSCLENPMDRGAWWTTVHGVAKSWTLLSDFTSLISLTSYLSLEKEMATHSSILVWRIPWMEEPGGPWSMGSQRVRHYWSDWACTQARIPLEALCPEPDLRYTCSSRYCCFLILLRFQVCCILLFILSWIWCFSLVHLNMLIVWFFNGSLAACSVPIYLDLFFSCLFWSVSFWWFSWPS